MTLYFYASESHYAEHLVAIRNNLPFETGMCVAPIISHLYPDARVCIPPVKQPVIVAGIKDANAEGMGGRPIGLVEHGVSQTYKSTENIKWSSNPGGEDRGGISLFLHPNHVAAALDEEAYPQATIKVVGSAWLDELAKNYVSKENESTTIAIAFRWPDPRCEESRWALPYYQSIFPHLADKFKVLAHAHPRIFSRTKNIYEDVGFTPIEHFKDILSADLLVLDNSSIGPAFAAITGKPIMWLNAPNYRRDVEHGLRYWTWTKGQICANALEEVIPNIELALEDPPAAKSCREEMINTCYTYRTDAALRAASAITEWLGKVDNA